eukprot:PLAT13904.2.p1 GENE.PLAT13904.2~~PLAT13904.2.p1  ORF type:complete len:505 (-),score=212.47 PLAT13904.2:32-1510(-)
MDQVLDEIGFGRFQMALMFMIGSLFLADGAEMLVLSVVSDALKQEWKLTPTETSALGSVIFVGLMVGSLAVGTLSDRYGRRRPIIGCVALVFVFGLLSALAPSYALLVVLRFMVGVGVGGVLPIGNALFAEFLPTKRRGLYMIALSMFFSFGEAIVAVMYGSLMPAGYEKGSSNWRILLGLTSVPAGLTLLCAWWIPESPRYLKSKGMAVQLKATLRKLAQRNGTVCPDLTCLDGTVPYSPALRPSFTSGKEIDDEGSEETGATSTARAMLSSVASLLAPDLRRTTLLVWLNWAAISYTFYGLVYIMPAIFRARDEHDAHESMAVWVQILLSSLAELPGVLVTALMVDVSWLGRRRSLMLCYLGCTIALVALSASPPSPGFGVLVDASKLLINGCFSLITPYTAELYDTENRATAIGCGSAAGRIGGILAPLLSEAFFVAAGAPLPFVAFAIACLAGLLGVCLLRVETAGKPLGEAVEVDAERSSLLESPAS